MSLRKDGAVTAALSDASTAPDLKIPVVAKPWRAVGFLAWSAAVVALIYAAVGRLGFYPADEGLIQAYTYRILRGEIPHRDFVSPRPLGSALLHIVDFVIPGPLFEVSRVVALAEYVGYAVLFAWLISSVAPWRWGVPMAALVAASVLVNLNTFPIMSWYTVDGLVLLGGGFVIVHHGVRADSMLTILAGFVIVGLAALTKQSFVPAPAFAWLLLVPRLATSGWRTRIRQLFWTGLVAALPSLIFIAVIATLGGMHQLLTQVLGTGLVYGRPLLAQWSPRHDLFALAPLVAGAALIALATARLKDRSVRGLALRLVLTAVLIGVPLAAQMGATGNDWGDRILWMTAAYWTVRVAVTRRIDVVGVVVLGTAWMTSLSYGFPYPSFVAGTMIAYVLYHEWSRPRALPQLPRQWVNVAPAVASLLVLAVLASASYLARTKDVYADRPANELTATLSAVSPAFGGIRTNPETAQYLQQMAGCIHQYPAHYVAILPENTGMYPALSLDNPFPIDWMWPDDIHGSEASILATTDRLNATGDYLVLFQTIGAPTLLSAAPIPAATSSSPIFGYTPLPAEIYSRLNGQHLTCGSFLVIYSPK